MTIINKYKGTQVIKKSMMDLKQLLFDRRMQFASDVTIRKDDRNVISNLFTLIKNELFDAFSEIKIIKEYLHAPEYNPPLELLLWVDQDAFNSRCDKNGFLKEIELDKWTPITDFGKLCKKNNSDENLLFYFAYRYLLTHPNKKHLRHLISEYIIGENGIGILNINDNNAKLQLTILFKNHNSVINDFIPFMNTILRQILIFIKFDMFKPFVNKQYVVNLQ